LEIADHMAWVIPRRGLPLVCKEPARLAELLISQNPPAKQIVESFPVDDDDSAQVDAPVVTEVEASEALVAVEDVVRQLEDAGVQIPSVKRRGRKSSKR
jgi:hypothetical protein